MQNMWVVSFGFGCRCGGSTEVSLHRGNFLPMGVSLLGVKGMGVCHIGEVISTEIFRRLDFFVS